ncbi:MAG: hypothetical protein OSB11_13145, partial [Gammaproteobacteria bacterium]|nr:hypothetical protein [Gammaproteobacteria bacterium]
ASCAQQTHLLGGISRSSISNTSALPSLVRLTSAGWNTWRENTMRARCQKSGGYFIINEFVGPNQFQWTEVQLVHCQRLLEEIPESYRQMIREPGVKHSAERPTIEFMNGYDPTEAIRSADIITELEKQFEIVERRDFGGTLLHLVLDNIAGKVSGSDEGKTILRNLFVQEQRLLSSGKISSDFTLLLARKK